ncbi:MAG: hypothetical protein ACFCVH_01815 [Alphaproteobacteria bacterium]
MVHRSYDSRRAYDRRLTRLMGCAITAAAIAPPWPLAQAAEAGSASAIGDGSVFLSQPPLSRDELAMLRGKFIVDGWEIALGLNIISFVDNALVQEVGMQLDDRGRLVTTSFFLADPLPEGVTILVNGELFSGPAPTSSQLAGLPSDPNGVLVSTGDGFSAVLHAVGGGRFANIITNDAIGRSLSQTMTVEITVANFTSRLPEMRASSLGGRLNDATALGIIGSLP